MSSMQYSQHDAVRITIPNKGQGGGPLVGALGGRQGVPLVIPLSFLLTGMIAVACFGLLLPWTIAEALRAPNFPHVLTLVHMLTLGWLTMSIMGASLQLVPVIIASPLRATPFLRWQYPLYAGGVLLLLSGFWWMLPWLLITGGTLVVLAVLHYIYVLVRSFSHASSRPLTVRYLLASLAYLSIVVSLGLTAALNFQFGFLVLGTDRLLLTHITLGVVGWLTCTLIGVSYTLARLFALAHGHSDRSGRIIFWLLNGGIWLLALGFSGNWQPLVFGGGLVLTAAVWLFGYDYVRLLRMRHRKKLDVTQYHAIASVVYLVLVVPLSIGVVLSGWQHPGVLVALALAALIGWLGQSIIGYLYKIVPFLIWHDRYGPLVGRQKVPLMREMVHEHWAWASWWLLNIGLIAVIVSSFLNSWLWMIQLASGVLASAFLLAMLNVFGVVSHLKRTKQVKEG